MNKKQLKKERKLKFEQHQDNLNVSYEKPVLKPTVYTFTANISEVYNSLLNGTFIKPPRFNFEFLDDFSNEL